MKSFRRILINILVILAAFIFQYALIPYIRLGSAAPCLPVIIACWSGYQQGEKYGAVDGFFCGLLADLLYGEVIGIYAFLLLLIGYGNGKIRETQFMVQRRVPVLQIAASDFVYSIGCYLAFLFFRGRFQFGFYLLHIIAPEVVYTTVIGIPLCLLLGLVEKRLSAFEAKGDNSFV